MTALNWVAEIQSNSTALEPVIAQYRKLRAYSDAFFQKVLHARRDQMQCGKGCSDCCSLSSVLPLEAYMMGLAVREGSTGGRPAVGSCPMLDGKGHCTVYGERPLICRTHGLALRMDKAGRVEHCPKNFAALADFEEEEVFDATRITENLVRLNLAFCMIVGRPEMAGTRVPLSSLHR